MPTLEELVDTQVNPMAAANQAGLDQVSYFQTITFTKYRRLVLPADGFVFWVRADLISPSALLNDAPLDVAPMNQSQRVKTAAKTLTVKGSLHYSTDTRQEQEETYAVNRVVLTAQESVEDLNAIAPTEMWLGTWDGIRFAFTSRSSFYKQAGLWHYIGDAVYADMETQIIDDVAKFTPLQIVSNSLPIWLSMNNYVRECWEYFGNSIALYPSFLAPNSLRPPFATVHVVPEATTALASAPFLDRWMVHEQLATDRVRITFWGVNNDAIQTFVDFVNQYSVNTDYIGIMNVPIVMDEKRPQSDLSTISQKKTIEYQVSYYQKSARRIARQLIREAIPTFIFN